MDNNIKNLIQKIKHNGKTLHNKSFSEDKGVKYVHNSTFIIEKQLLIKGEYGKENSRT
jgi:hypothetical protein